MFSNSANQLSRQKYWLNEHNNACISQCNSKFNFLV